MFSMLGQYLAMLRDNFSGAVIISSDQVEFLDIAQANSRYDTARQVCSWGNSIERLKLSGKGEM